MLKTSDPVLTLTETCAETRLCRQTIWKLQRQGDFPPPLRLGAQKLGWRRSTVEAWLARGAAE